MTPAEKHDPAHQSEDAQNAQNALPALPKAGTHRERVQIAQTLLARAGLPEAESNPPALRLLVKLGIPVKPFLFWSAPAMALFMMCVFSVVTGLLIVVGAFLGALPRFAIAILEGGPFWFLVMNGVVGAVFAMILKGKAAQHQLPRWRDI